MITSVKSHSLGMQITFKAYLSIDTESVSSTQLKAKLSDLAVILPSLLMWDNVAVALA